ncbi:MAG: acyl transferase [Elusimicrobia bacterium]|nr:acyl transferase [Elusimicrobiota bacterium]
MHPLNKFLRWYPALILFWAGVGAWELLLAPSATRLFHLAFILYAAPLLTWRLLNLFHPIREGLFYFSEKDYSPWLASNYIQDVYNVFPGLEGPLLLAPGLFSLWLRLWGSSVGRGVYWAPQIWIIDRGLMDIGDGAVFGSRVVCFGHIIKPKKNRHMLYIKKVRIGAGAFVGAASRLTAGASVEAGASVPIVSDLYPNRRFRKT